MTHSVVFMGTPEFAVPPLEALVARGYDVRAVVTQPDRPKGRGRALRAPPVKDAAQRHGIEVIQPRRLKTREAWEAISPFAPDFLVVAAYGQLLGPRYLDLAEYGPINVHASLLPRYRGAAPIHWSIVRGEAETGISIMRMELGLDSGPVYSTRAIPIIETDSAGSLHDKLAPLGAELLVETLPRIADGSLPGVAQDDAQATLAPLLSKVDGALRFDEPARTVADRARGMDPWPGAFCRFRGKNTKVYGVTAATVSSANAPPGTILGLLDGGALGVATADGALAIREIHIAGKKRQPASEFVRGYDPDAGECFEPDPRVAERRA